MVRNLSCAGKPRHLVLAVLLATVSASGISAVTTVRAQGAAQTTSKAYNIPSQSLSQAILTFGRQSGVQVTVDNSLIQGKRSQAVSGDMTAAEALGRLLGGTGLTYRFVGANAVTLERAPEVGNALQLGAIRVEGAENPVAGRNAYVPGEGGYEGPAADAPYRTAGSTNYISRDTIERFRGATAGDIFKSTPGVISAMNTNGASVDVNIRGLQGMNRVVTSVDGSEQAMSTWRGYAGVDNRSYIDPDLIGGVRITKGPEGGASGATGGTVAISTIGVDDILRDGQTYGVRLRAGLSSNGIAPVVSNVSRASRPHSEQPEVYDAGNASFSLAAGVRQDRLDLVFAYVQRHRGNVFAGKHGDLTVESAPQVNGTQTTDTLSNFKHGDEVLNTSEEVTSGLLKARVRISDAQTLDLGYLRYENAFGEVMPSQVGATPTGRGGRQLPLSGIELDQFSFRYNWRPAGSDQIDLKLNGWLASADETGIYYTIATATPIPTRTRNAGLEVSNTSRFYPSFGDISLRYGASYKHEDARPRSVVNAATGDTYRSDGTREIATLFASGKWTPKDWLTVDGSLNWLYYKTSNRGLEHYNSYIARGYARYDSYEGNGLSPNVGVTFTPDENWQIYARFSSGIRPPSLRESTFTASMLLFNPDLKHERAENYEIGVNYLRNGLFFDGDKSRLKLAYFDNRTKNYIGRLFPDFMMKLENFKLYQLKGLELSGSYETERGYASFGASHYTDFRSCRTMDSCVDYTLSSDYSANHMPPKTYLTLAGGLYFFDKRLNVGGRVTHTGKRLAPLVRDDSYFFSTKAWTPYTIGDLYANWKFSETLGLDFVIENVGDRYYVDALNNSDMPASGRTYRVNLTSQFGGGSPLLGGRLFGADGTQQAFDGNWSGPYVGMQFGQVTGRVTGEMRTYAGAETERTRRESAGPDFENVNGGVLAGFNYQYANGVVIGLESDVSWGRFDGRTHVLSDEAVVLEQRRYFESETFYDRKWLASLRARLGYTLNEETLVYVTGGLAATKERQTRIQYKARNSYLTETEFFLSEQSEATRYGWTLGGGFERAIGNKWSLRTEYLYSHFGNKRFFFPEARQGVTLDYQTNVQVGTQIVPSALPATSPLCTRAVPHPRCSEREVPIYETITGTANIEEGRVNRSGSDVHNLRIALNYRF
ncbi:MAG: TonB-dependent receptor [Asticcacaulis sp.]